METEKQGNKDRMSRAKIKEREKREEKLGERVRERERQRA